MTKRKMIFDQAVDIPPVPDDSELEWRRNEPPDDDWLLTYKRGVLWNSSLIVLDGMGEQSRDYVISLVHRHAELIADLKHAIFPGWQSYEEWVKNGRTIPEKPDND